MPKIEDRTTSDRLAQPTNYKAPWFVGLAVQRGTRADWPLEIQIAWKQRALEAASGEFVKPLIRESQQGADPFKFPASYICPPACMLFAATDDDGKPLYGYQPSVHVMGGKITSVSGPTNAFYGVESLDGAIAKSGLTPMDRWAGIDYVAHPIGRNVLLLCTDAETLKLIAFETPELFMCPPPAMAEAV